MRYKFGGLQDRPLTGILVLASFLCVYLADARYLSTPNSWGFTGTTIGLYAIR